MDLEGVRPLATARSSPAHGAPMGLTWPDPACLTGSCPAVLRRLRLGPQLAARSAAPGLRVGPGGPVLARQVAPTGSPAVGGLPPPGAARWRAASRAWPP